MGKQTDFVGKKIVILGLARQGMALAQYAAAHGAHVTVSDLRPGSALHQPCAQLKSLGLGIQFVLGAHPLSLLDDTDIVAISGSVPADAPFVNRARARGIAITNDSQEFLRCCPAPVIGITGSAGKSTTTSLLGEMCKATGTPSHVGGNLGYPLINLIDNITPSDYVVQELSSFQLEIWEHSPHIAAILNITPNHLDRHGTMDVYTAAKAHILHAQSSNDVAVLHASLSHLHPLVKGRLRTFDFEPVADGAFIQDDAIMLRDPHSLHGDQVVCLLSDVRLVGRHNLLNVLAAVTLADSAGVPISAMQHAIQTFSGIGHRIELAGTIDGVQYINDSIATAPERAIAAIHAFEQPMILLTGGRDKKLDWQPWAELVAQKVKTVILFGELGEMVYNVMREHGVDANTTIYRVSAMQDAIQLAHAIAQPDEIVLLSPGGTSYDAFTDFAERGEQFKQSVRDL